MQKSTSRLFNEANFELTREGLVMKKNIPLLKRLRTRFLRTRHPQHFRMTQIAIKTDCGAAMCFIGHTLDIAGFKMRFNPKSHETNQFTSRIDAAHSDYDFIAPSGRKVLEPFRKAARLLGLGDSEAERLFQDYSIKTPKQAAQRIQEIIYAATVERG